MKNAFLFALSLLLTFAVAAAQTQAPAQMKQHEDVKPADAPHSAEWQKLSSLVGLWEGTVEMEGKPAPTTVEVRMTGDNSAIMHVIDKGGPYEMVTMFHPDGQNLLATHYCSAHNQPRLKLTAAPAPNQLAFDFMDGTNIAPGAGHMAHLVITFVDADHHDETWTYTEPGKSIPPTTFHYARKK